MRRAKILIAWFLGIPITCAVAGMFNFDLVSEAKENRVLAAAPSFRDLAQVRDFTAKLSAYAADNFGFRKSFLRLHGFIDYYIFKTAPSRDVIMGKEGWLFFSAGKLIDYYRNTFHSSDQEIDRWVKIYGDRARWLAERKIPFFLVIPPNSSTVYADKMPDWATVEPGPRDIDIFLERLAARTLVHAIDLNPILQKYKREAQIYQKTDTHWNDLGAYYGYRAVMDEIRKLVPDLPATVPMNQLDMTDQIESGGDLALYFGLSGLFPTHEPRLRVKSPTYVKVMSGPRNFTTQNPLAAEFRLLLFRDSFAIPWEFYIANSFSAVRWLWTYMFEIEEIENFHPRVVIHELVERQLQSTNVNPSELEERYHHP